MSVVTGVALVTAVDDRECTQQVNNWLAARDFGPLVEVDGNAGGTKHPECRVLVAGYNYFGCTPDNALDFSLPDSQRPPFSVTWERFQPFVDFVIGLPWERGESVVLIINPPDLLPVRVHRVPEARWSQIW